MNPAVMDAVVLMLLVFFTRIACSQTQFTAPGHKDKVNIYLPKHCGEATFSGLYGVNILSQTAGTYAKNTDCLLHIKVPKGFVISLTFVHFDLEPAAADGSCSDFLQVFNGNSTAFQLSRPLCGGSSPHKLLSNTSIVTLKFHSDREREYTGFQILYDRHPATALEDPDFLVNYDHTINSPNGSKLQFQAERGDQSIQHTDKSANSNVFNDKLP